MNAQFDAFFIAVDGDAPGQRFCLLHPAQGTSALGAIVYIHPFAEEMNKSRRMASMQARALARAGYSVLMMDLAGCGDSSGDFADATWQVWVHDVVRGCQWLGERVQAPLWLWGLRAGCLLAVDAARHIEGKTNFLLWAPTPSGQQVLQQFLRLKVASELANGNTKGIMNSVRSALAQGSLVEIAGYRLNPGLAHRLEEARLDPPSTSWTSATRLEWFELSARPDAILSPMGGKVLALWKESGHVAVRSHVVQGPAFWQTTEIEDAPNLIEATVAAMSAMRHP